MIKNTGVVVSEAHRLAALARARGAAGAPVIKLESGWLPDEMRLAFGDWLDALARSYGLPPPKVVDGETIHYGMNNAGEFTVWEGDETCPAQDILGT